MKEPSLPLRLMIVDLAELLLVGKLPSSATA